MEIEGQEVEASEVNGHSGYVDKSKIADSGKISALIIILILM